MLASMQRRGLHNAPQKAKGPSAQQPRVPSPRLRWWPYGPILPARPIKSLKSPRDGSLPFQPFDVQLGAATARSVPNIYFLESRPLRSVTQLGPEYGLQQAAGAPSRCAEVVWGRWSPRSRPAEWTRGAAFVGFARIASPLDLVSRYSLVRVPASLALRGPRNRLRSSSSATCRMGNAVVARANAFTRCVRTGLREDRYSAT